jgi:ATP phosphoribosyltransferase regulatory subunit
MFRRSLLETPSGVQCFLGEEARLRREIERTVADVFRGWCYEEIVLPLFDFDDVFTRGGASISALPSRPQSLLPSARAEGSPDGIYRLIGRDGEVMALRADFTALVAKMVVSRLSKRELPLRLFYSGEVLRYQPPRAGLREELFQIGLEHLGAGGVDEDLEVILVAREAMARLGVEDAVFTLGHVGFAHDLLRGVEDPEARATALDALRRHDRQGLVRILGSGAPDLTALTGGRAVLEDARRSGRGSDALARLEAVVSKLEAVGFGSPLRVDLSEVRDFDYYTGVVFEIHAEGSGLELGGGGRYDTLLGRFGRELPAVGFYLSLDRVSELLSKRGVAPPEDEASPVSSLREAIDKRKRGKRVFLRP